MNLGDLFIETWLDTSRIRRGLCMECGHQQHTRECVCGCDWENP